MQFLDSDFSLKIITIVEMDWPETHTFALPRPFNALSLRLHGDSVIRDQNHRNVLKTGDVLFMPENLAYSLDSGYEHIIVVHFELDGVQPNTFEVISDLPHSNTVVNIFTSLRDSWRNKDSGYYFHCLSLLYRLFELLVQKKTSPHSPSYHLIAPAMDYLHAHFADSALTIEQLYRLCNLSDTYFRRIFFAEYKTTPLKYINTLRVDYAEELLQTGFYTVSSVSQRAGFSDPKYFSTAFKKIKGYSPSCCK